MSEKIDCSIAVNYIAELQRMCATRERCTICEFGQNINLTCKEEQSINPQKSVEIVQAWSDEHPRKTVITLANKLLEFFPDMPLDTDGTPDSFCPGKIGYNDECIYGDGNCTHCWSQPYKENTNG